MSLKHAVLVSLAERDASGYDLARRFDRSLGFFWKATHQQIYRVLGQMAEEGLVASRIEAGEGKPDRRVYSLTDAGRAELRDWTLRPTPVAPVRSEFAVKVRGMNHGDPVAVVSDIRRIRAAHHEQLAYFEANCARNYPDPNRLSAAERPLYAVLRGGIRTERSMVEWCDEMLELLIDVPVESASPIENGGGVAASASTSTQLASSSSGAPPGPTPVSPSSTVEARYTGEPS